MKKRYILAPGPTMVPSEVLLAMAEPTVHHRSDDFTPLFNRVNEGLKYVFQTVEPVIFFAASGTGAMEAAVVNTLCAGDKVIVLEGGKFGERWGEIAAAYGVEVIHRALEWGEAFEPAELEKLLAQHQNVAAVFTTLCDTSSGVTYDIEGFGKVVSKTDALLIVDAVSGLGAEPYYHDKWKIDITVTGSQKALMLPPGLAFITLSKKARGRMATSTLPKYFFSLPKAYKALDKNTTAYTPAVNLLYGLDAALTMIQEEGLEAIWARHKRLAKAIRAGVQALGLELFAKHPANVVTAVKVPQGIDGGKIPKLLNSEYGITIAGGQEPYKGKIFRIATLGYADTFDAVTVIAALEMVLGQLGYAFEKGAGITKTLEALEG